MYILGLHGNFGRAEHDAAAVLLKDGRIIAAAEEERFLRYKHAVGVMPTRATQFCLDFANIGMDKVDVIAFPRKTWQDFEERLAAYLSYNFGYVPALHFIDHHTAHAASAYYLSGFPSALTVTFDQSGDGISAAAFRGSRESLEIIDKMAFPHSLGLFAAFITQYLGFRSNHDEYKVMGLASYGDPKYDLSEVISLKDGKVIFNKAVLHPEGLRRYPVFHTEQLPMFNKNKYKGLPKRRLHGEPITKSHKDLAASAQKFIEVAVHSYIDTHCQDTDEYLCISGGVGENSVVNGMLAASLKFKDIYVSPSCGDAGTALGAALQVAAEEGNSFDRVESNKWGPSYSDDDIENRLKRYDVSYTISNNVAQDVAKFLKDQNIVALFDGRMEFGPRALGSRSLIADPSSSEMRDKVNKIKKREQFRPFAPSVLLEHVEELFVVEQLSPFMSFTLQTTHKGKEKLKAAIHVDGTGRLQTVPKDNSLYREIIEKFYALSGIPAVLNTSLNSGWEPIIESPDQALAFFFSSETDVLVLNKFIIRKHEK